MSTFFRFQGTVRNAEGPAVPGVEIYVCTQPITSAAGVIPPTPLATIYSDSIGTPLANPVVVDGNGNFFFYAATGLYSFVFFDPENRIPTTVYPDQLVQAPGGGSVTSVALTAPDGFAVTGSPIIGSGTLALAFSSDWNANTFLAGPASGPAGAPTRRTIVAADLAGAGGIGTVSSVNVTFSGSALFVVGSSGGPITTTGTIALTLAFANQAANNFLAGPTSGGSGALSARAIVGADLPVPSSSSLGGVQSLAAITHQFLTSISTSGVPTQAQPAFSDLSGIQLPAQQPGLLVVTFSATPAFNAAASNSFQITLTGDVSSSTVTNPTAGQTITFIIIQDATGSRTFAFPANFKGATAIDSVANHVSVQSFIYDGTNWRATSAGQQTSS